jgi:hypothetical protein
VPAVVGVPEITPAELIVRPGGRPDAVKVGGGVPVAMTVNPYAVPTVPVEAGGGLVIDGATGAGRIAIEKACVASGATPLEAVIVPVNVLTVVGTPEITPAGLIASPFGKPDAVKVMGAVPVAVTVWV